MKNKPALLLCLAMLMAPSSMQRIFAQTPSETPPEAKPTEPDTSAPDDIKEQATNPFMPGESCITLSAGLQIPVFMLPDERVTDDTKLKLGGAFSLGYQYFVLRGFSLGGTLACAFDGTAGGRTLYTVPISFRMAYWWAALPFEFSAGGEIGIAILRLGSNGMITPFFKTGIAAYWKITPAWSLGLQTNFWLVPEIHGGDYSSLTRVGAFVDVSLAAVYHI